MGRNASNITILLLTVTLFSGFILVGSEARADVVDVVNITVPSSCSLSTNSGLGETYNVSMTPGQYKNDIGDTTISVFCNANDTFSIYAIGYSNDTYGNTEMISNNTATTGNIATGTAINGSTSAWAMKLTSVTGTYAPTIENGFGNFSSVPPTYTKVASIASAIAPITGISQLKATYAIYIAPTQKEAVYTGKVKYTVVNPNSAAPIGPQTATSGCINYFPNGSNVVGTMGCQTIYSSDTSAQLLASNFSRDGFGFAGWSDAFDYSTNPNANFYGPQEKITFNAGQYTGSNNGLALYAVWVPSAGSLQDSTKVSQLCGTGTGSLTAATNGLKSLSSVSALTDQRDSQTYAIAKLADGNCWMIENLRLEGENTRSAANQALAQGYGTSATYGNFGGLADVESANFSNSTNANSLYYSGTQSGTASIDIDTIDYPGYRMPRYNNTNTSARSSSPISNNSPMYSYGNYYTWHAAIADTTYYDSGDHGTTSLCPVGWRLPIGNESTENNSFGALSVALGGPEGGAAADTSSTPTGAVMSEIFKSYPNNFLYSGYFEGSSVSSIGSYGYYWSSTTMSYGRSNNLRINRFVMFPGENHAKVWGCSIRCIANL